MHPVESGRMPADDSYPELNRFITLGDGVCHYRLDGPQNGSVLLMIHGATVPGWEFDRLAPLLQAAGIRTLVPDLYGHGNSARPRKPYDYELFCRQIDELLEALAIDRPVDVLGHSMGAAIAARLACRDPDRYGRLLLVAPLVDFTATTPATRVLALPGLGELLAAIYLKPMLVRRRRMRYRDIEDGRWVDMFRRQIRIPGSGRMLLSLLRRGTLGDQRDQYVALNRQPHELLVMRGDQDTILPRRQFDALRESLPRAQFVEIRGLPHALVITDPEKLAPPIVRFLSRPPRGNAAEILSRSVA
ncbi:MAG: alpha/beta hydrolase [Gammaproteobacteria bacterium]|jgi:pimeloyl-ACP methyl ester carboxylesterase